MTISRFLTSFPPSFYYHAISYTKLSRSVGIYLLKRRENVIELVVVSIKSKKDVQKLNVYLKQCKKLMNKHFRIQRC